MNYSNLHLAVSVAVDAIVGFSSGWLVLVIAPILRPSDDVRSHEPTGTTRGSWLLCAAVAGYRVGCLGLRLHAAYHPKILMQAKLLTS
jgi:hypothetical protein